MQWHKSKPATSPNKQEEGPATKNISSLQGEPPYSFRANLSRITAQEASPVMDMVVRAISTRRSMPAAMATPSIGMPAEANTIAIRASEPPGMPGVPMDAMVDEMMMARYC